MAELPIERLRELFDYDPASGGLTWRCRPREDFANQQAWRTWLTRFAGKPAKAFRDRKGYLRIRVINGGVRHSLGVHRVAWALALGSWPLDQIDHRNRNRSDNRLANLREATAAENIHNMRITPTQGTWVEARTGRFRARIYVDGKNIWLGYFASREAAHAAYLAAKPKFHPFSSLL